MSDPFQPVIPGQAIGDSLRSSRTENGLRRSGQAYARSRMGTLETGDDKLFSNQPSANVVLIYNGTGAELPERSIIAYGAPVVDPDIYPLDAQYRPAFEAAVPSSATLPFVVLIESIPVGGLGEAACAGQAVVDVSMSSAAHTRAVPSAGVTANLVSAAAGGVPILRVASGTGLKRAQVLVGSPSDGGGILTGQTSALIPVGTSGPVDVSGVTFQVYNQLSAAVVAGKPCLISWVSNASRYQFIAVDTIIMYSGTTAGSIASGGTGNVTVAGVGTVPAFNQWNTTIPASKKCLIGWVSNESQFQFIAVDC